MKLQLVLEFLHLVESSITVDVTSVVNVISLLLNFVSCKKHFMF